MVLKSPKAASPQGWNRSKEDHSGRVSVARLASATCCNSTRSSSLGGQVRPSCSPAHSPRVVNRGSQVPGGVSRARASAILRAARRPGSRTVSDDHSAVGRFRIRAMSPPRKSPSSIMGGGRS